MWRMGALLVLIFAFIEVSSNDTESGPVLSRLRRSPQYWPPPPPYRRPPYWPPPPPPYWHHHHHDCDSYALSQANVIERQPERIRQDSQGYNNGQGPGNGLSSERQPEQTRQGYNNEQGFHNPGNRVEGQPERIQQEIPRNNAEKQISRGPAGPSSGVTQDQKSAPEKCDSCDDKTSKAISNAKSDTGDAIAVAVARAVRQR